jgi:hypothetical protein
MDFTLSPCSPAIDAGDNAANSTVTDLAGNPRTVGSTSNLPVIDMGAYELPGCPTATPNTWTGNGDGFLWTDPANWSDGVVPCQCHDVLIPTGNDVTIPTGAEGQGRTLEVELGAQLLTDPAATMEIGN